MPRLSQFLLLILPLTLLTLLACGPPYDYELERELVACHEQETGDDLTALAAAWDTFLLDRGYLRNTLPASYRHLRHDQRLHRDSLRWLLSDLPDLRLPPPIPRLRCVAIQRDTAAFRRRYENSRLAAILSPKRRVMEEAQARGLTPERAAALMAPVVLEKDLAELYYKLEVLRPVANGFHVFRQRKG